MKMFLSFDFNQFIKLLNLLLTAMVFKVSDGQRFNHVLYSSRKIRNAKTAESLQKLFCCLLGVSTIF